MHSEEFRLGTTPRVIAKNATTLPSRLKRAIRQHLNFTGEQQTNPSDGDETTS
jgi:hypothetical protein